MKCSYESQIEFCLTKLDEALLKGIEKWFQKSNWSFSFEIEIKFNLTIDNQIVQTNLSNDCPIPLDWFVRDERFDLEKSIDYRKSNYRKKKLNWDN